MAAAAAAIVLVACAGCSSGSRSSRPVAATSSAGAAAQPTTHAPTTPCRGTVPPTLRATLHAQWQRGPLRNAFPFDGRSGAGVVSEVLSTSFAGVGIVHPTTGAVTPVEAFSAPGTQAAGAYDGDVAVWKEYPSPANIDRFSVKIWTPRTGVRTVGGSHSANGRTFSSPWTHPVLADGYAAWVEGIDAQGRGRIMLLDARTGHTRVARVGHPGALLIYRHILVWAESLHPGAKTRMFAERLPSLKRAPVPPALAHVRGTSSMVTDQTGFAWVGGNQRTMYYAASEAATPRQVIRLRVGGFNPPMALSHGVLLTGSSNGVLAAIGTGIWAPVGGASVAAGGDGFFIAAPNGGKGGVTNAAVTAAEVQLGACAKPPVPGRST